MCSYEVLYLFWLFRSRLQHYVQYVQIVARDVYVFRYMSQCLTVIIALQGLPLIEKSKNNINSVD